MGKAMRLIKLIVSLSVLVTIPLAATLLAQQSTAPDASVTGGWTTQDDHQNMMMQL